MTQQSRVVPAFKPHERRVARGHIKKCYVIRIFPAGRCVSGSGVISFIEALATDNSRGEGGWGKICLSGGDPISRQSSPKGGRFLTACSKRLDKGQSESCNSGAELRLVFVGGIGD